MSTLAEAVPTNRGRPSWLARARGSDWHRLLRVGSLTASGLALLVSAVLGSPQAMVTALLGLLAGLAIARLCFRGEDRAFATTLFLVAWGLRVVGAVATHEVLVWRGTNGFLLLDDRAYDKLAWAVGNKVWTGIYPGIEKTDEYLMVNYTYLVAVVYYFLGHALLAAKMLNVAFGALTAVVVFALGLEIFNRRVAMLAAALAAFFPSMALWSMVNLKDPMVVLLSVTAVFGLLRFARRHDWRGLVLALAAFLFLENLRPYVFLILSWMLPIGFLVADRSRLRPKMLYFAPLLGGVALISVMTNNEEFGLKWLSPRALTDAEWARYIGAREAGSGTEENVSKPPKEPETIGDRTLSYLPRGVYYALLGPTPWEARSGLSRAVIPEMLLWYGLFAVGVVGLVVSIKRSWRDLVLPMGLAGGVIVALALTAGNTGNLFRHRSMYLPYAFLLAAVGLEWLRLKRPAARAGFAHHSTGSGAAYRAEAPSSALVGRVRPSKGS